MEQTDKQNKPTAEPAGKLRRSQAKLVSIDLSTRQFQTFGDDMELLEILKIINDQSKSADTQAQIMALKDALIKINTDQTWFIFEISVCAIVIFASFWIVEEIRWSKVNKRLKKLELASSSKNS